MSLNSHLDCLPEEPQVNQRQENIRKTADMTLEEIEKLTGKSIIIERDVVATHALQYHDQAQSGLFGLPAELRNLVFALAIRPFDERDAFQCKSMHASSRHSDFDSTAKNGRFSVLLTCRRVWLEANSFALQAFHQAEHAFWLRDDEDKHSDWKSHQPWDEAVRFRRFNDRLTTTTRRLTNIHLYTQLSFVAEDGGVLGDSLRLLAAHKKTIASAMSTCTVRTLIITLRDPGWHQVDFHEEHFVTRWLKRLLNTAHALNVNVFKLQIVDSKIYLKDRFLRLLQQLRDTRQRSGHSGSSSFVPESTCTEESWLELQDQDIASGWTDKPLCGACHRSNVRQSHQAAELLQYQAITLTWKRAVSLTLSYHPHRSDSVVVQCSKAERILDTTREENDVAYWEKRWAEEGSLLKFDRS